MGRHTKGDDERRRTEMARARRRAQQKRARKPKRPVGPHYADPDNPEHRNLSKRADKNGEVELEAFSRKSTRRSHGRKKASGVLERVALDKATQPRSRNALRKRSTRHTRRARSSA